MLTVRTAIVALVAASLGCHQSQDAQVIGAWQCNPRNGKVWRMTFTPDHKLVLALPAEEGVDANQRDAKFNVFTTGTWHIDGDDVVYTVEDKEHDIPKTITTRMKLADFKKAAAFGTNQEAYLERL